MRSLSWLLLAGTVLSAADPQRIEITLERRDGENWTSVPSGLVFAKGDRVRFRVRSNFDGFLYAMNQGSSGRFDLLFPREETGSMNRIEKGKDYFVPATQAWFRIDGPPGFDTVHWVVSPVEFAPGAMPRQPRPAGTLRPRCDDVVLRARGLCIDATAGPRAADPEKVPDNIKQYAMKGRELTIIRNGEKTSISAAGSTQGPAVYEFRLAHN